MIINFVSSTAVQNERDRISRKPVEEQDKKFGLTTQLLLSAEILSRPAQSPPGILQIYDLLFAGK